MAQTLNNAELNYLIF